MSNKGSHLGIFSNVKLVILETVTSLHPGIGSSSDVVDLPVQKDVFGYPTIYSSSLKGVWRSHEWRKYDASSREEKVKEIFGDENQIGKISLLDATLLFIPVRSLKGVALAATSPFLLKRFKKYISLTSALKDDVINNIRELLDSICKIELKPGTAVISSDKDDYLFNGELILNEDLSLKLDQSLYEKVRQDLENFYNAISLLTKELFNSVVLLNDDDLKSILTRSLIKQARVKLNYATKTTSGSGLWMEEYVPEGTLFYTLLFHTDSMNILLPKYLVIGGNETLGKGVLKNHEV